MPSNTQEEKNLSAARWWLFGAVQALAISGVFAVVLVLSRVIKGADPLKTIFYKSLVVHVDLSVLVWFLAMVCLIWCCFLPRRPDAPRLPYVSGAAAGIFIAGLLLMASSFFGGGEAHMSNYIPVIASPLFFLSLGMILAGVMLAALDALPVVGWRACLQQSEAFAAAATLLVVLLSFAAFYLSAWLMRGEAKDVSWYDSVFWAGGHLLQFAWVEVMMLAWIVLSGLSLSRKPLLILLGVGPAIALLSPVGYLVGAVDSEAHRRFFTEMMKWGNAVAPGVLALWLGAKLVRCRLKPDACGLLLIASLVLFFAGGFISLLIAGQDTRVPAHYHGSIVGVTLALMGLVYHLLPSLGGAEVRLWKMARLQPLLYGFGQLAHITGLAWAGGYGIERKTPGDISEAFEGGNIAAALIRHGGSFAILGGMLFVVVVIRSMLKGRR